MHDDILVCYVIDVLNVFKHVHDDDELEQLDVVVERLVLVENVLIDEDEYVLILVENVNDMHDDEAEHDFIGILHKLHAIAVQLLHHVDDDEARVNEVVMLHIIDDDDEVVDENDVNE